jgi:NAD(P)-dependent dehydrogenase (short-subunit alcohol dehydrogenase family)
MSTPSARRSRPCPDAVIVTGAGRGIGRAIAIDLGHAGAHVVCVSRTENAADTAAEIRNSGGRAEALVLDLADYDVVEQTVARRVQALSLEKWGVVLAAGVLGPAGPLTACSLVEWDECHRVNVLGNLGVLRGTLPSMVDSRFGRVVFFAGGGAAYANPSFPAYAASKTAIVRIAENVHEDLTGQGDFSVVCIAPGAVDTDMLKAVRAAGVVVKTPADMSEPVNFVRAFLSSSSCSFSGGFVHVRDEWQPYLDSDRVLPSSLWRLRRRE